MTNVGSMTWRGSRGRSLVALGFLLARRGLTGAIGLALTALCVLGFGVLSVSLAHRGRGAALADVPLLASSALTLGVGVLVAFAVSTGVFGRDEEDGLRALLRARGIGASGYLGARVLGLAALLGVLASGGSLLIGLVTLLVARGQAPALHTLQATLAAAVFCLAFAVTFAAVAMAALGARTRGGGYLALLSVLLVPELLRAPLAHFIEPRWLDVCSIPGALFTLRTALAPVGVDFVMLARSLVALVVIVATSLLIVRAELRRSSGRPRGASPKGRDPT